VSLSSCSGVRSSRGGCDESQVCSGHSILVSRRRSRVTRASLLDLPPSFSCCDYLMLPLNSIVESLILRFHFKCINLSDEEAEKIRKSISPLTRPVTNSTDDYICENCHAATGKKTTSKSNKILILLTPHLSVQVDSLLCHLLPIQLHYCYVYCLLGLISSAILYAGRHLLGCWILQLAYLSLCRSGS